jgi:plastocyanin
MNRIQRSERSPAAQAGRWAVTPWAVVLAVGACLVGTADRTDAAEPAAAPATGSLSVRFLYDGEPPVPEKLELNKDQEFCGQHDPVSERLLVDAKSRGLKNVIVWLDTKASGRTPELPEAEPTDAKDADAAKERKPPRMDNVNCRFDPHVVVMEAGQELHLENKDPVAHAMLFYAFVNTPVSRTLAANAPQDDVVTTFEKAEPLPVKVTCPIHSWMLGWLVVQEHPFVGVSDSQGRLKIDGLPPGEWTFRVWQEASGYVQKAARGGKAEQWDKGLLTVTIQPGENALGDVKLAPEQFAE